MFVFHLSNLYLLAGHFYLVWMKRMKKILHQKCLSYTKTKRNSICRSSHKNCLCLSNFIGKRDTNKKVISIIRLIGKGKEAFRTQFSLDFIGEKIFEITFFPCLVWLVIYS